jgi:RNA polymerase sigma factor (sigma-70 family)
MKNLIYESTKIEVAWKAFIKSGELNSLEPIYNLYFEWLFNYGKKYGLNDQLIEDAVQNVFISLIKSRNRLSNVSNLHAYLFCSFRNELFSLNKKEHSFNLTDQLPSYVLDTAGNIEEDMTSRETELKMQEFLNKSIKKLTPSQQEILYLRFYSGLSYDELSKIVGISVGSCRTSVYRALKAIKTDIETLKVEGVTFYF